MLNIFYYCSGLTSVHITDLEAWCKIVFSDSYSNPLYYAHHLFLNGNEVKDLVIPNSVTSIGYYAFQGCSGLTSVNIPNSVTSIGQSAFNGCTGLTSATIPNSVTSIGESAFEGCSKASSLKLPDNISIIKARTFYGCKSLKSIVIPASVEFIYQNAFAGCTALESVKVLAETPPFLYDNSFSNYNIPLYVPETSVIKYQTTNPWSRFSSFKTLTGDDVEVKTCAKPTISYSNGKMMFNCETEGANCQYTISDNDIKSGTGFEVSLSVTYNISVIATKSGYQNSEIATATLCWIDVEPRTEGIYNGVASVRAMPVVIQNNGNVLSIIGAPEGCMISVYDLSGQLVGSAKAGSEPTNISTSLQGGEIGIVKIGDKSVKVSIK